VGAEIQWVLGFAMALVGAIGGFITRDRQVHAKIAEIGKEAAEKAACLSKDLDSVRRDYVRRDDLSTHLGAIEKNIGLMREEQREHQRRMDKVLTSLANKRSGE
jgi:hypothetical protein